MTVLFLFWIGARSSMDCSLAIVVFGLHYLLSGDSFSASGCSKRRCILANDLTHCTDVKEFSELSIAVPGVEVHFINISYLSPKYQSL